MDYNQSAEAGLTRSRKEREEGSMKLNVEEPSAVVVDTAFHLYRDLGPGLLESVYEVILAKQLQGRGLSVARQLPVTIVFAGLRLDEGFRADLVVDRSLVIELKSVEQFAPVHALRGRGKTRHSGSPQNPPPWAGSVFGS